MARRRASGNAAGFGPSGTWQQRQSAVARDSDHDFAIRGIIFDIDKEFYHVDWGQWGKKPVPINWVESLLPWRLIYRSGDTTPKTS